MSADRTADLLEVQGLVAAYSMAWDRVDAAGVTATFTSDGRFVDPAGAPHQGPIEIGALVDGSFGEVGSMRHITSTHVVDFESDRVAHHSCYLIFVSHPRGERRIQTGEYSDHLVRTDEGWRFHCRQVTLDG